MLVLNNTPICARTCIFTVLEQCTPWMHNDAKSRKCDRETRPSTHPQNRQTWPSTNLQHPKICESPKSSTSQKFRKYTSNQSRKISRFQHVSGCTWKDKDVNKLCPKIYNKTQTMFQRNLQRMQPFITLSFTLSECKLENTGLARELSDIRTFKVTSNKQRKWTASYRWTGGV